MQVTFVIGGAQKSGTTALDAFLRQHPEICMVDSAKATHFFDTEENFVGQPEYERYHRHFCPLPRHRAIGETTPIYMYWESAPSRIWSYNPKMKWILLLRNPVLRAFSQWNMAKKKHAEPFSFRDAVEKEVTRCREALPLQHRAFSYVDRGYYAHQVRRIFRIFGEENCLIILNEDMRNDHCGTLRTVFGFLGVDQSFVPPAARVFEQSYDEEIGAELYTKLMDLFHFDIRELERLLRRDLSSWYSR
jgi:Sulfotransferase domain